MAKEKQDLEYERYSVICVPRGVSMYASFICSNCGACAVGLEVDMKIKLVCNDCGSAITADISSVSGWYDITCSNCNNITHLCIWKDVDNLFAGTCSQDFGCQDGGSSN